MLTAAVVPLPFGNVALASGDPRGNALRAREVALGRAQRAAVLDLYALESRLSRARTDLAVTNQQAAALAHRQALLQRRRDAVAHSLATARDNLTQMLRTIYKHGQPDPVAIVLGAASIDEAVTAIDDLRRSARANERLVTVLEQARLRLRVLDVQLQAHRRALRIAQEDVQRAVSDLTRAAAARNRTIGSLRARRDLTRRQVARLDRVARAAQRRSAALAVRAAKPLRPASTTAPAAAPTPPAPPAPGGIRTLVVDAVAYHLPGTTASGLPVGMGVVAVDPTVIPLGTRLFVPGYGPAVAADVGSAVKGSIIDLWMPSRAQALAWGRRTVTITVYG